METRPKGGVFSNIVKLNIDSEYVTPVYATHCVKPALKVAQTLFSTCKWESDVLSV